MSKKWYFENAIKVKTEEFDMIKGCLAWRYEPGGRVFKSCKQCGQ